MRCWMSMGKRGLALFLALLMCLNLLSLTALADTVDPEIPPTTEEALPETLEETRSEDSDDLKQSEQNSVEPPADNEELSSDSSDNDPASGETVEEQVELFEEEISYLNDAALSTTAQTARGWYQDTQTVKGDGAVCKNTSDGGIHLKAGSENGNGHGATDNGWPAMFVNDELSAKLYEGVADDATKFVEVTFTPVSEASASRFGVYINYTNPGCGFIVGYDNLGWYWEEYGGTGATYYMQNRVAAPDAGAETTLRFEWKNNVLTKATANGTDLFLTMPVDFSTAANNSGTKVALKCGKYSDQITEVTISSIKAGIVEPPAETTISGTVTDGSNPVEGVVVTLENASYIPIAGKTATTGADGKFSFENVTGDGYKVKVQADGYQVTTGEASAAETIVLKAATTGTKVYTNSDGDLTQMGGLTETNAPTFETVDGAVKVTFHGDRSTNSAVVKKFDFVNGEISFDATPTGSTSRFGITLRGTAGDNRIFMGQNNTTSTWFWNTWANGSEKYNTSQDQTGVPLSVQSGVTRNVRAKIEGSTVSVYLDGIEAYTITLPDGIPTGAGYAGIVANSADPVVLDNIRVVSLDSDEPTPPATYTLSGKVTGENGTAVSGATVTANGKTATTDASGAYSIEGLESGTYTVSVSAAGYDTASQSVTISNADATANVTLTKTAPKPDYDGECGAVAGTVFYKITDGVLHIWGEGEMADWTFTSSVPWKSKNYSSVVIDKGVTTVGQNAFNNNRDLKTAVLPDGLTKIGSSAFKECQYLTSVNIPDSVKTISSSAFEECKKLSGITLPEGLTAIYSHAFSNCDALTSIVLPQSVTRIENYTFYGCDSLESIDFGGVREINNYAFASCSKLASVTLPEGLETLGDQAFTNATALTSITIPSGVNIRNSVFAHAPALKNIVLLGAPASKSSPSALKDTYSSEMTIYLCNSDEAGLVALQEMIGTGSTLGTYRIIDLAGGNIDLDSGDRTPNKEGYTFQGWLDESGNKVENPDFNSGTYTAQWAEKTPEPTYIAQGECGKVAGTVFYGLTEDGVLHIWGNGEMKDYSELSGGKPYPDDKRAPWLARKLEYNSVVIKDGVTSIGNYAFQKVDAKYNPPEINLTSVSLPSTLTHIGNWAFKNSGLAGQTIKIPDSVTSMGTRAFIGTGIVGVELSAGMKYVPDFTFSGCKQLTNVTIPEGTISIGENAFANCSALKNIELPNSLVSIKSSGFEESGLTSITLPQSVTTIYGFAFSGCTSLTKVDLGNVKSLGSGVFQDCTALESITLPNTLKELYNTMFWKTGITSITIPDGVNIRSQAFDMMKSLRNIVLVGTPKLAGSNGGSFGWMDRMGENIIIYVESGALADTVGKEAEIGVIPPGGTKYGVYYIANLDGGTLIKEVAPGKLAPAEKAGFEFKGWQTADGTALTAGEDGYYAIPADTARGTVYTAKWEEPKVYYTVNFNANGGTLSGENTIKVEEGKTIGSLPTATRTNYVFKGWFNGSNEFTTETPVTGDVTVTAKWVQTFNVTIEDGHGGDIFKTVRLTNVEQGMTVSAGNIEEIIAAGKALGWKLVGWTRTSSSNPVYYQPNDPLVVTNRNFTKFFAKWELIPTAPTFPDGRNIRVEYRNESNDLLTATGFTDALNEGNRYFTVGEVIANDGTNSAAPASTYPYQCTLTLNAENMLARFPETIGVRVLDGEANPHITLYCRGSDGRWATWIDGVGSYNYVVNYTINVKLPTYTVTVDGIEHTVKRGDTLAGILPAEDPIREGYTFQGWFNGETEVTAETEVKGGMTVTSRWELNSYTVTVDGTEHIVKHGDKLGDKLPENPAKEGYTFSGWFCDGIKVDADTVVTGAMTVESKWDINIYTVTVGEQKITVKHGESLGENMPTAPSRSGYEFSGWFTSESGGERITAETPITRDVTLYARWTYVGGGGTWTPSVPAPTPTPAPNPPVEVEDPDVPLAELPLPFEDVKDGDWYREAVAYVWSNDLMVGTSDKIFGVNVNTTRGMMATMLYRLEKEPDTTFKIVFDDVEDGKWFSLAVTWANANGVVLGYGDGNFGPDDDVTREQLVAMLYRYSSMKGFDVSKRADLGKFADAGKVSAYAKDAMSWAVASGIIQGRGANTLAPTDLALRVEVAVIFQRFAALYEAETLA